MHNNQNPSMLVPRKIIENYSYQLTDQIGKGYSSKVFQGKDERTGESVAIKVIDMKMIKNEVQSFLLQNEIKVMKKLQNQNCLKLLDVFQTHNNTYIITEICNNGDLKQLIQKYSTLSEQAAIKILRHIINGIKELAKKNIIHRDLKPANIFIKDGIPKLADFGFSKDLEAPPCKMYYNVGTPMYMSPQSLKQNIYSMKSDIWSIGGVYYEMLFGCTPWDADSERELADKISQIPVSFPAHPQISDLSKDFIKKCLTVDESKRISIDELDQHPLISQFSQIKPERSISQNQNQQADQNLLTQQSNQSQNQFFIPQPSIIQQNNNKNSEMYNINNTLYNTGRENGKENNSNDKKSGNTIQSQQSYISYDLYKNIQQQPSNSSQIHQKSMLQINNSDNKNSLEKLGGGKNIGGHYNNLAYLQPPSQNFSLKTDDINTLNTQSEKGNMQFTPKKRDQVQTTKYQNNVQNNNTNNNLFFNIQPQQQQQQQQIVSQNYQVNPNRNLKEEFTENDQIILSQINYCRFLIRLSKLTEEFSNTRTPYLKDRLQFLIIKNVMIKITRLKELCKNVNSYQLNNYNLYINNESYDKFIIVINEYYYKYTTIFQDKQNFHFSLIQSELKSDKKFEPVFNQNFPETETFYLVLQQFLVQSINEMNINIKNDLNLQNEQISQQSEGNIVLLDYLVTYYQLTQLIIEKINDFLYFSVTSKIEQIAEGRPVRLTKQHFSQIRNKILSLDININQPNY